jgi:hypothetical protein
VTTPFLATWRVSDATREPGGQRTPNSSKRKWRSPSILTVGLDDEALSDLALHGVSLFRLSGSRDPRGMPGEMTAPQRDRLYRQAMARQPDPPGYAKRP